MGTPLDSRFLSLVVHDLLTPLNVIGLTIRMIEQAVPRDDKLLHEDLGMLAENASQMERMLRRLSQYSHLTGDEPVELGIGPFDPRRLLDDVVEERRNGRPTLALAVGPRRPSFRLEIRDDCPPEVELDQDRARLALQMVLDNAAVATSEQGTVRVVAGGRPGRWIVSVAVDGPTPHSVQTTELHSDQFKRLMGIEADRLGLDLAIAARVTELFGGTARLEVEEGRGTTIVLDWPTRIAAR